MEATFHLNNLWAKAYKRVEESEYAEDLKNFEDYLQIQSSGTQQSWVESHSQDGGRLKEIQKLAKEKLEGLSEARTSFTLGGKRIIVREYIQKAVQTIKQFKPIISGALSAEPQAALVWACILGVLPILESLFQRDEDAAEGLTKIIFMLVRYQNLEESVLTYDSEAASHTASTSTHDLLLHIEDKLIGIYEKVYLYQIRFILQYGRGKWRRNMRGILKPEDWKEKWKEIDTARQLVDQAVQDRVGARSLETWATVNKIEMTTTETLKAVHDMDARMKEMDIKEQSTQERELLLQLPIAADAAFDSAKVLSAQSFCLEGTQHDILCKIGDWTEDPSGELIFWLYSMAGTGKSSIALTVADALKQRRPLTTGRNPPITAFLGASLFFKQVDNTRNDIQRFFTTIAWSLAEIFDDFKPLVAKAVDDNLTIGTKAPQQQLQHLVAENLSILDGKTFLPIRLIVVVDALDECLDRNQAKELISLIAMQLKDLRKVQLRVLITSRREEYIQQAFSQLEEGLHRPVPLEKIRLDEEGDNDDITRYIGSTLRAIARQHDCEDDEVPTSIIKQLSEKANGLFIYAATACRFLDAGDFADPMDRQDRLDLILEASSATDGWGEDGPQNHIDDIYLKVLSFPAREKLSPGARRITYEIMKNALGFLVTVFQPVTIPSLVGFVQCVVRGPGDMRERLQRLLKKLQAIVTVPTDEKSPLELMHLSFRDFILNKERTKHLNFEVDESEMHKKAFLYCLGTMSSELHQDICGLEWPGTTASEIPDERVKEHIRPHLRYVCCYWVDHLMKLDWQNQREIGLLDGGSVHTFLQKNFLYWLEVIALIKETDTAIRIMDKLQTLIESTEHEELFLFVQDMKRFTLRNSWIIEQAPLQIYASAIVFSPEKVRTKSLFQSHIPSWVVQLPEVDGEWSSELSVLKGHTDFVYFVACSPVESLIVSLSEDKTARIWDAVTGAERFTFDASTGYNCAAFSPDGKSIAFGSGEGTIHIREFAKGTKFELEDCDGPVVHVIYSPKTGSMVASVTTDLTFKIWSIGEGHAENVISVTYDSPMSVKGICQFTSNEQYLIVAGSPQSMTMWDTRKGQCIRTLDGFDTRLVRDFSISRDGSIVALVTRPGKVAIINLLSGECEVEYPGNKYRRIIAPPDGTYVLVQTVDGEIFRLNATNPFGLELCPASVMGQCVAMSSDGQLLASGSGRDIRLRVAVFDSTLNQTLTRSGKHFDALGFSPESTLVYGYSLSQDNAQIRQLNGERLALRRRTVKKIRFSPNGNFVALRVQEDDPYEDDGNMNNVEGKGNLCELWNRAMTTQPLAHKQWKEVFFSPDGRYLALLPSKGEEQAEIVDSTTLETVMTCQCAGVSHMEFSPDGQLIVIFYLRNHYSSEGLCEVWNVLHGEQVYLSSAHIWGISKRHWEGITFSPDCSFIALISARHTPHGLDDWKLVNLTTGVKGIIETQRWAHPVFDARSHLLAIRRESFIDIRETSSLVSWGHLELVGGVIKGNDRYDMAFSAPGRFVCTSREYGTINTVVQQWDIASRTEIGRYAVGGDITHLSFSDDRYLVCDQGRLPLPQFNPGTENNPNTEHADEQDLLYVGGEWLYRGSEKLMWLPLPYQSRVSRIQGNTLALSHEDGNIRIMRFDLSAIPVRHNVFESLGTQHKDCPVEVDDAKLK